MKLLKLKIKDTEFKIPFDTTDEMLDFITHCIDKLRSRDVKIITGDENDN